jgi:adenosylmethionine-8-amino-7-oxononanoate aminotransferase
MSNEHGTRYGGHANGATDGNGTPTQQHIFYRDLHARYPVVTRAKGIYLYEKNGKKIIDGAGGAAVVCLGHGNKRIIRAMKDQAEKVAFAHMSAFTNEPAIELSNLLAERAPGRLKRVYFTSGGSEAVETAIKLARAYHLERGKTQKFKVISRSISYHGATIGALSMTGTHLRRGKYVPMLASFPRITPPYCYRCPYGLTPDMCELECAWELERAIVTEGPDNIAAFIAEPVIGASAPAVYPPVGYNEIIRKICDKYDILFIADEVMSGVGRTGKFLATEHYRARPHILCLSKGISSGYAPLGAVLVNEHIFSEIRKSITGKFIHGHTFAGNPVSCRVGLEVIRIIDEKKLVEKVASDGVEFAKMLVELRRHPLVGDVRVKGFLAGIEFVADRDTRDPFDPRIGVNRLVAHECLKRGLYVYPGSGSYQGNQGDHVLLAPPYIIKKRELTKLVGILDEALGAVTARLAHESLLGTPGRALSRSLREEAKERSAGSHPLGRGALSKRSPRNDKP